MEFFQKLYIYMKGNEELNPLVQLSLIASTESPCLTER